MSMSKGKQSNDFNAERERGRERQTERESSPNDRGGMSCKLLDEQHSIKNLLGTWS